MYADQLQAATDAMQAEVDEITELERSKGLAPDDPKLARRQRLRTQILEIVGEIEQFQSVANLLAAAKEELTDQSVEAEAALAVEQEVHQIKVAQKTQELRIADHRIDTSHLEQQIEAEAAIAAKDDGGFTT